LDPVWYSTMFGVYMFAGAMISFFAAAVLLFMVLQRLGLMPDGLVTQEHYHDLGKWLFGFVFFWGYIAFSQYMLIWYGNIPEENTFYAARGVSLNDAAPTGPWGAVALLLLFGHFLIPFPLLLSRWVKRGRGPLAFAAAWMLVVHLVDMIWVTLPAETYDGGIALPIVAAVCCWAGIGGLWLAGLIWITGQHSLIAHRDPRIGEAVAFENI